MRGVERGDIVPACLVEYLGLSVKVTEKNINGEVTMNDPFQDVDKAGLEFAENTAKTMEIRQSEPIMEKIVHDYLTELEFVSEKPTIEIGCGPGAISRRIAKHASRTHSRTLSPWRPLGALDALSDGRPGTLRCSGRSSAARWGPHMQQPYMLRLGLLVGLKSCKRADSS